MATSGPITYLVMEDQFLSVAARRNALPPSMGMPSPLINMHERAFVSVEADVLLCPAWRVGGRRASGSVAVSGCRAGPGRGHRYGAFGRRSAVRIRRA